MKRYVKSSRVGKTKPTYVSQEYVPGYGWEDVTEYGDNSSESWKLAKDESKSYRDNGYGARVITRRIPNTDYVEPTNELTMQTVIDYFTGDNADLVLDELYNSSGINYVVGYPGGSFHQRCQVIADDNDEVSIRNISTNRTKRVYTMKQFEDTINKILNQ